MMTTAVMAKHHPFAVRWMNVELLTVQPDQVRAKAYDASPRRHRTAAAAWIHDQALQQTLVGILRFQSERHGTDSVSAGEHFNTVTAHVVWPMVSDRIVMLRTDGSSIRDVLHFKCRHRPA